MQLRPFLYGVFTPFSGRARRFPLLSPLPPVYNRGMSKIPWWIAATSHAIVVVGIIAIATVFVHAFSGGSVVLTVVFYSTAIPAWLIFELIRWINRRSRARDAKRPSGPP